MSAADVSRFLAEGLRVAPGAVAWIARFETPGADTEDRWKRAAKWMGEKCTPDAPPVINGENAYYSIAAFRADATTRTEEQALGVWAIFADDVGEKAKAAEVRELLGDPTARIRTSEGSEQWVYFLDQLEPVAAIKPIYDEIGRRGLSDVAGLNSVRYGRLPAGRNTKPKPGRDNYTVHFEEFRPERRFSLAALAIKLGITGKSRDKRPRFELPAEIPDGEHNDTIARYALQLFNAMPGREDMIRAALNDANLTRCKPKPMVQWKVDKCFESARKKALAGEKADDETRTEFKAWEPLPADIFTVDIPPQEFVWKPWVPRGVVTLLVAEGGTGKTNLAIGLALRKALGRPLFSVPTTPGSVVYIGMEDHINTLLRRFQWIWKRERDSVASDDDQTRICAAERQLFEKLRLVSYVGGQLHLVSMSRNDVAQSFDAVDQLIAKAREQRVELLILDPLSRLHGSEENLNHVGTAVINAAERIAVEVECAVIIMHHTGKDNARNRDVSAQSARGASAIVDAARSMLRLIVANDKDCEKITNIDEKDVLAGNILKLVHAKSNLSEKARELWLRRVGVDFEHFIPEYANKAAAGYGAFINTLRGWWESQGRVPFSKNQVEKARGEIFSAELRGRNTVRCLLDQACAQSDLVPAAGSDTHYTIATPEF